MDKQLTLTKQVLSSILISYQKHGITATELSKQFYATEGEHIPYHELGFNSLIRFLESIDDVLRIQSSTRDSRDAIIYPVANASTAHIRALIKSQKNEPNKSSKSSQNNRLLKRAVNNARLNAGKMNGLKQNEKQLFNREIMIANIEMILRENSMPWFNSADLPNKYYNLFKECLPSNWIESIRERFDITVTPATNGDITLIALKLNGNTNTNTHPYRQRQ